MKQGITLLFVLIFLGLSVFTVSARDYTHFAGEEITLSESDRAIISVGENSHTVLVEDIIIDNAIALILDGTYSDSSIMLGEGEDYELNNDPKTTLHLIEIIYNIEAEEIKVVFTVMVEGCTDTDGGLDYYKKGEAYSSIQGFKQYDECVTAQSYIEAGYDLEEHFCGTDVSFEELPREGGGSLNTVSTTYYDCPNGCVDGACIQKDTSECTDSDGGKDFYQKGIVTSENEEPPVQSDFCYTNNTQLFEHWCEAEGYSAILVDCEYGCDNGACLKKEVILDPTKITGPLDVPAGTKELDTESIAKEVKLVCSGCLAGGLCYPLGYRKSGEYCLEDKSFVSQLKADSICDNNFECSSNLCIDGECISSGFWQKIISWLKNLL